MAKHAVDEDDHAGTNESQVGGAVVADPMQGLEELDVAGPKPE